MRISFHFFVQVVSTGRETCCKLKSGLYIELHPQGVTVDFGVNLTSPLHSAQIDIMHARSDKEPFTQ